MDVPTFRSKFLHLYHSRYRHPLKDYLVGNLEWSGRLLSRFPAFSNALFDSAWGHYFNRLMGLADLPRFSKTPLHRLMRLQSIPKSRPSLLIQTSEGEKELSVILIQDAFSSFYESELILAFYRLLEKLGFQVHVAPLQANGKPLHVKGFLCRFHNVAEANARFLSVLASTGMPLVGIEPSIILTYRDEYPAILKKDKVNFSALLPQEFMEQDLQRLREHAPGSRLEFQLLGHCMEKTGALLSQQQWISVFEVLDRN